MQRITQRDRILSLFQSRQNEWVPLPDILDLRISQFGARILELRRLGYDIRNRTEHRGGQVHSWFRLVIEQPGLFDA